MLDSSDLGAPLPFEVDRVVTPSSLPPRPPSTHPSAYPSLRPSAPPYGASAVAVQAHRRCHVDGLPLDEYGDCHRCQAERATRVEQASRRNVIALIALAASLVMAVGLFFAWRSYESKAQERTAAAITQRNGNKVVVYTTGSCPACTMARKHLDANNIPYVERRLDADLSAQVELESLNVKVLVPTFVVGNEVMQGFDPSGITLARAMAKHNVPKGEPAPRTGDYPL